MTRTILFIILLATIFLNTSGQQVARVEFKELSSKYFPFNRQVLIYTPENYDEQTESEYDVIYVLDSQSRSSFDLVHSLMHYSVQTDNDMNFIVVGIVSLFMPEIEYNRNNDFLPIPHSQKMISNYYGSSDKFKKFIKDELMPYIDENYRTTKHSLGIGHSLGASFVLDALASDELFDDYIAISPNFGWDKNRFAHSFMNYNYNNNKCRFIYISMGNESEATGWPKEWRPAWDMVKKFIDTATIPKYIKIKTSEFPNYEHNKVYLPALMESLTDYVIYRHNPISNDSALYPVHIELSGTSITGNVYITGNQSALADWNPQGIKMRKINDTTYSIDLELRLPVEFKFTQGSWDNQIWITNGNTGNQRISLPSKATKHYKTF